MFHVKHFAITRNTSNTSCLYHLYMVNSFLDSTCSLYNISTHLFMMFHVKHISFTQSLYTIIIKSNSKNMFSIIHQDSFHYYFYPNVSRETFFSYCLYLIYGSIYRRLRKENTYLSYSPFSLLFLCL